MLLYIIDNSAGCLKRIDIALSKIKLRSSKVMIPLILVLVIIAPVFVQPYYSQDNGLHQTQLPTNYYDIPRELKTLVGDKYTSVAFFNPDNYLFFGNSTVGFPYGFPDSYTYFPSVRTIGIPSYNIVPIESNQYFYWVYKEFYHNNTSNLAQLMGIAGVEYFIVLFNTNSASDFPDYMPWSYDVNASNLMEFQKNVSLVYENSNYAIYKNDLINSSVYSFNNITLFAGDLNSLNYLASKGLNLSSLALIFPGDVNKINEKFIIKHATNLIIASNDGLINLALSMSNLTRTVSTSYLSNLKNGSGWVDSWGAYPASSGIGIVSTSSVQFAFANGYAKMNIPLKVSDPGKYDLWTEVMYSGKNGGLLNISINGCNFTSVSTNKSTALAASGFTWVELPFETKNTSANIVYTSLYGDNGIRGIYLTTPNAFNSALTNLHRLLSESKVRVIDAYNVSSNLGLPVQLHPKSYSVSLEQSGFTITGNLSSYILLRVPYFSTFSTTNNSNMILPALSSLNTLLAMNGNLSTVEVFVVDTSSFYLATSVAFATIVISSFYIEVRKIKKKER
jgi:hypothetical protein